MNSSGGSLAPRPKYDRVSRRSFLFGVSSFAIIPAAGASGPRAAAGRLSVGLSMPSYYNGFCPFLNWWKQAAPLQVALKDGTQLRGLALWNAQGYLDPATGELSNPVPPDVISLSRIIFSNTGSFQRKVGCDYSGEEFSVVWEGSADVRIDLLTPGGEQTAVGPNQVVFKLGTDPQNTAITFTVKNVNDPPRAIKVFQTRYARNVGDGEVFNPDWIDVLRQFRLVRCMDWMAISNSTVTEFSQLADMDYCAWGQPFRSSTAVDEHGGKGGVHPRILCELANVTGADLHVCIPHRASDAFVESFARFFKDHTTAEVTYELSNECWNGGFTQFGDFLEQGERLWPGDPLRSHKYYGWRAAECMKIVSDVYAGSTRWRGALATQTVNIGVTDAILSGIREWMTRNSSLSRISSVSMLFNSLYVTGYFGDVTRCTQPQAVTQAGRGVVSSPQHGYRTGESIRIFVASGMTQLNGRDAVIERIDNDNYAIDIDTSACDPFVSDVRNYAAPASLFRLMDASQSRHETDPAAFPTPYLYFNQQMSQSLLEGRCAAGVSTDVSVAALRDTFWPAQLSLASIHGLTLRQYEGGCHLVGDGYLAAYGGNERYTEYALNFGHSAEAAAVYDAMYDSFLKVGGEYPSKYVADGAVSQYGAWAGIRYWPTSANGNRDDTGNPVWQAVVEANRRKGE